MESSMLGLLAVSVAAFALGHSPDAHAAAAANFLGLCNWNASHTQFSCNFDANRPESSPSSCPGSFVWKYQWDFDDGSTLLTGNPVVSQTFPNNTRPLRQSESDLLERRVASTFTPCLHPVRHPHLPESQRYLELTAITG